MTKHNRLAVVTLHRDQIYVNLTSIQNELNDIIKKMAPSGIKEKVRFTIIVQFLHVLLNVALNLCVVFLFFIRLLFFMCIVSHLLSSFHLLVLLKIKFYVKTVSLPLFLLIHIFFRGNYVYKILLFLEKFQKISRLRLSTMNADITLTLIFIIQRIHIIS